MGKAIVLKLASMGVKVAFTFLSNREKADQVVEEVNNQGIGHVTPFAIDAANPLASELLVGQVVICLFFIKRNQKGVEKFWASIAKPIIIKNGAIDPK